MNLEDWVRAAFVGSLWLCLWSLGGYMVFGLLWIKEAWTGTNKWKPYMIVSLFGSFLFLAAMVASAVVGMVIM